MAEIRLFRTPLFKVFWVFLLPLFYALRPCIQRPKRPNFWEIFNIAVVFAFNYFLVHFFGFKSLIFLVYSTLMGMGLHPVAGNLIAEHYEFVLNTETYSYYGILNFVNFNVGYHNEHHDFPCIPWTRLPKVNSIAREFYKDLPCYSSYLKVFYYYIMSSEMGPFSRITRDQSVLKK
ncbi:Sphingolipid delta(4)-desaturase DES1 [Bonamia ostreae]|uniref:Sphingolipid delta(4)-desaturase DES1 n=1 Tax=Bonamia ostreae TaxID=126728 RepID=A0ABV2AH73_9EUKA